MAHLIRAWLLAWLPAVALSVEQQPLPFADAAEGLDIEANLCELPPRDQPCGVIPHDVTGFTASSVYMLIERSSQDPFDLFAWKSFVALNWPLDGQPLDPSALRADSGLRIWESWEQPGDVFDRQHPGPCRDLSKETGLPVFETWRQADGHPLVDRWGNYLVYDVRVNAELAGYVRENSLHSLSGLENFAQQGRELSFPAGHYDNAETRIGGSVGSIAIKSAWRILAPNRGVPDWYRLDALVPITGDDALDGHPACLAVHLGLVGMHIMHRTKSASGEHWIWATFEHDANAPFSRDSRGPNNIFAAELFPDGCRVAQDSGSHLLFDPACAHCPINAPPEQRPGGWRWAMMPPHARHPDGSPVRAAQIVRCWRPAVSTRQMNNTWKRKLAGTVWANYSLSTTQWRGAPVGGLFPAGEVPRYLTNSTMESFLQTDANGTCLGCHIHATTPLGQPANGSFLFMNARDR